ncbi:hypothetical protein ILUMI_19420 [Ignelater luminosus]|uniref:Uncharacterized protein n=1 Tax=Ignelater luminosus TaxID=2038154 RepID=A0A8K0G5H9_IGNLU|nr:hypothetical protein ILUMI_19420 [Ignelater luminosus]
MDMPECITPYELKPFPKAGPRKQTVNRRKRKSAILTDSPIEAALEDEARKRENRKQRAGRIAKKIAGNKKREKTN